MERLKNTGLVLCLFVVLLVIFSSYFRANEVGTFFGALAGDTASHSYLEPRGAGETQVSQSPKGPRRPSCARRASARPTQRVLVLRMEGPTGRP